MIGLDNATNEASLISRKRGRQTFEMRNCHVQMHASCDRDKTQCCADEALMGIDKALIRH